MAVLAAGALAGCSSHPSSTSASGVIKTYGRVPVPTAGSAQPTATAAPGHAAVLEMGAPVRARLDASTTVIVTALGPEELDPTPGRASTPGLITMQVHTVRGTLTLRAADLTSRDESGRAVTLRPEAADRIVVPTGRTARIVVRGTYSSGAAQLTWRYAGRVIAVWDFNIELD